MGSLNSGHKGRGRYRPLAEINVTPLVDVMLVLLIIFMVTAPLMTSAINVDLPKADASPVQQDSTPITVSVKADGTVYLGDNQVQLPELVATLQSAAKDQKDRRIFVRGDKAVDYGRVMVVAATIVSGGFTKASLLVQSAGGAAPVATPLTPGAVPVPAPSTPAVPAKPGRG